MSQVDPFAADITEFFSLDTDDDGYVGYHDICQELVGYAFCGEDASEETEDSDDIL